MVDNNIWKCIIAPTLLLNFVKKNYIFTSQSQHAKAGSYRVNAINKRLSDTDKSHNGYSMEFDELFFCIKIFSLTIQQD